jgi:hypothetical protein
MKHVKKAVVKFSQRKARALGQNYENYLPTAQNFQPKETNNTG